MLCSCLQIQCLKTAAPATLHYCQAAAGLRRWSCPGVLVNIPSKASPCSHTASTVPSPLVLQEQPWAQNWNTLQPDSSTLEFQSKVSQLAADSGGNGNGLDMAATQAPVLCSQGNQVPARTGGGCYRTKVAFSASFIFGGFAKYMSAHIFAHRSL